MKRARALYDLQEIDLRIGEELTRWQEVQAALGESAELCAARQQLDAARARMGELEKAQRQVNFEIQDLSRELASIEARSQKVRNFREAEGMRKKAQNLRKRLDEKEIAWLELDEQHDNHSETVATSETHLAEVTARWEAEQQALQKEDLALRMELTQLKDQHVAAQRDIAPDDLATYEDLRRSKRGRAVAVVKDARCQGCGVGLPSGLAQQARQAEALTFCGSCGRILCA